MNRRSLVDAQEVAPRTVVPAIRGGTMDMTLQQLRMLREVASLGTIAAAATSLGYTPSAVSQQLSALERATGVPVLERVGRNVQLTDAGRELVRHAADLFDRLEAARVAMEQVTTEVRGVLVVSVYESVATTLLPKALAILSERYPDLEIRSRQLDNDPALEALGHGDIDVAFAIDYPHSPDPPIPGIERHAVTDDPFRLIVPADSDLHGPRVALAGLAGRSFIGSSPFDSCGRCMADACRAAGFEPDIVHQLDDYPTILRLVAGGHGIGLVPDLGLDHVPDGVRVLDIDPPFRRTVQLACRQTSAQRPSVVAFREVVDEAVAHRQAEMAERHGLAG